MQRNERGDAVNQETKTVKPQVKDTHTRDKIMQLEQDLMKAKRENRLLLDRYAYLETNYDSVMMHNTNLSADLESASEALYEKDARDKNTWMR